MRSILAIIFTLFFYTLQAATYYVSNTGNNSNSGLTQALSWQTLSKVNSTHFSAGDRILFQKGNTFYGCLTVTSSGTSGNPIVFSSYGTGANPIITGFYSVRSWTNLGGNIWESSAIVSFLPTCNLVVVNGVNTAMGRTPNAAAVNSGYFTFQSHSGKTAITSSSLNGTPNWTGAEVAIRCGHFMLERSKITSQSRGTLIFSPATVYENQNGFGFFIQNDVRTLDVQNEWYYNPIIKKIRIYSSCKPTDVKVTSVTSLFNAGGNYITAKGIDFTGSNGDNIIGSGTHITIQNCPISFSGMNHLSTSGAYCTVIDNTFTDANNNGISIGGSHSEISRNTLTNSGLFQGMGRTGGFGINSALSVGGSGTVGFIIEANRVINSGLNGIVFYADSVKVKNNFVDNFCTFLDDGAGIYTYTGNRPLMHGAKIEGNIIVDGKGDHNGTSGSFPTIAAGIYCDESSNDVEIFNNTVANCQEYGIFQNITSNINIHHNTIYNASAAQIRASWSLGITINNNKLVSRTASQLSLYISSGNGHPIPTWISADNNLYVRPLDDNRVFFIEQPGLNRDSQFKTLTQWRIFSGKDTHSHKSPVTFDNENKLFFACNPTNSASEVTLDQTMKDLSGVSHSGSITLPAFGSLVLIKTTSTPEVIHLYPVWNNTMSPKLKELNQ